MVCLWCCDREILDKEFGIEYCKPGLVSMTWQLQLSLELMVKVGERVDADAVLIDKAADAATAKLREKWLKDNPGSSDGSEFDARLRKSAKIAAIEDIKLKTLRTKQPYFVHHMPLPLAQRYVYEMMRLRRRPLTDFMRERNKEKPDKPQEAFLSALKECKPTTANSQRLHMNVP